MEKNKEAGFGPYYDSLEVGQVLVHSPGKTITEAECHFFSLLTMNHHPVHINSEYAREALHGQILVVGTLVFSLAVGQSVRDISGRAIANLEYESIRHVGPVFIGDTVYSRSKILKKTLSKSKPDRGVVYVETSTYNQEGKLVLQFRRKVLLPRK